MIAYFISSFFPESILNNLLRYISFRAILAALISFVFVIVLMPKWISFLKKRSIKQTIRDDGPQSHHAKSGTPAMGGLIILLGVLFASILCSPLNNHHVWISLLALIAFGAIGLWDDVLKFTKKNSKGVSFRMKMLTLGGLALLVTFLAQNFTGLEPKVMFPFFKGAVIDLGIWFYLWGFFVLCGASNAVNLTDGLDGLAIVPIMTTAFVLIITSYVSGHHVFANYLQFDFISGSGELSVGLAALIGAGLAFLWYNCHPAQIFMGDVGSLGMGGYLGAVAVLTHKELILGIAGFLFVIEAISVMMQVGFYKWKKRRIFKMAPIHHHFELSGWPESKVIVRLWILSILFALAALSTLKIR